MIKLATAFVAMLAMATIAHAEIRTSQVEYHDGDTVCEGYLAFDDSTTNVRPGVLIFPEWWGLTDFPKDKAIELAKLGYVAFVADVYGNGVSTEDAAQAGKWSTPFHKDRKMARARCQAALDTLLSQKYVDKDKVAATGYCFGGMCALELARAGAPLVGVVTFHGDLSRSPDEGADNIKAKILVCHGADDSFVGPKVLADFEKEMKEEKADYQINIYCNAVHAFTNPAADTHHIPGIAYNPEADHRSWTAMRSFFGEVFKAV
jgi:dienelactone hydrolase